MQLPAKNIGRDTTDEWLRMKDGVNEAMMFTSDKKNFEGLLELKEFNLFLSSFLARENISGSQNMITVSFFHVLLVSISFDPFITYS